MTAFDLLPYAVGFMCFGVTVLIGTIIYTLIDWRRFIKSLNK